MFTKRHEQELAEIKALTSEISTRFEDVLKELENIKKTQDQLAARGQPTAGKRGGGQAEAADGGSPETQAGAKRGRRRQPTAAVAVPGSAKSGKRRGRAGSGGDSEGAERGAAAEGSSDDGAKDAGARRRGSGGRKRDGGGRKQQRQASAPTPSTGADEE